MESSPRPVEEITSVEKLQYELKSARWKINELEAKVKAQEAEILKLKTQVHTKEPKIKSVDSKPIMKPQPEPNISPPSVTKKSSVLSFDINSISRNKQPALLRKTDLTHREKVVVEIFTSEQTYVNGLLILVNVYLKTLLAAKDTKVPPEDISKIFGNVEQLLIANTKLLEDIEQRLEIWNENDLIGDILSEWSPSIKYYCRYAKYYEESLKQIDQKKISSSAFKRILEELDADVIGYSKLGLRDYFITPVQRVPRYCLLVRDLIKQTPENHKDYPILTEALVC